MRNAGRGRAWNRAVRKRHGAAYRRRARRRLGSQTSFWGSGSAAVNCGPRKGCSALIAGAWKLPCPPGQVCRGLARWAEGGGAGPIPLWSSGRGPAGPLPTGSHRSPRPPEGHCRAPPGVRSGALMHGARRGPRRCGALVSLPGLEGGLGAARPTPVTGTSRGFPGPLAGPALPWDCSIVGRPEA